MRVTVITEVGERGRPHKRELKMIPPGSWGVTVIRQTEDCEPSGFHRSRTTAVTIVGKAPHQEILTHTYAPPVDTSETDDDSPSGLTVERVLYWSDEPFILIEEWESPLDGKWARPAHLISEHGLTKCLPEIDLPDIHPSTAHSYGRRPTKWVRLTDLAGRCGLDPLELVRRHQDHFEGYDPGVYIVRADDPKALMQIDDRAGNAIWTYPDWDQFFSTDPHDAWVRLHFAQVVMCFHRLGWHDQHAESMRH